MPRLIRGGVACTLCLLVGCVTNSFHLPPDEGQRGHSTIYLVNYAEEVVECQLDLEGANETGWEHANFHRRTEKVGEVDYCYPWRRSVPVRLNTVVLKLKDGREIPVQVHQEVEKERDAYIIIHKDRAASFTGSYHPSAPPRDQKHE